MIDRRSALKSLAAAAIGAGVSGCATRHPSILETPPRRVAPVMVSADRITRTTVGLRPFRPSGFVVRGERLGEKLVFTSTVTGAVA